MVDSFQRGVLTDTREVRNCIELDRGIALHVVTEDDFEKWRTECGTAPYEADVRGIVLFDNRGEP